MRRTKGIKEVRQQRLAKALSFIREYLTQYGYAPNLREIAQGTDVPSTNTISGYLDELEASGLIERGKGKARAIRVKNGTS